MENTSVELAQIQLVLEKLTEEQQRELAGLQLVLVGGGGGDVVFA